MKKFVLILFVLLVSVNFAFANDVDINKLTKAANKGKAEAQEELSGCYYYGKGVEQDYELAIYWAKKAAEQGQAEAQARLGYCYFTGTGVAQDYKQAFYWHQKAAEQGNMYSQIALGSLYYQGFGTPQNYKRAYMWTSLYLSQESDAENIEKTTKFLEAIKRHMTQAQIIEAQDMATEWFEKFEKSKK